jgi:leucyl aminopeptidase (aminopeptidase T)
MGGSDRGPSNRFAGDWAGLVAPRSAVQRARDFLRFLGGIEQAAGRQGSVRVVATLPGIASSRELQEWLARRRGFWIDRFDDPETWRSRVLRDLEWLGRRPSAPGQRNERGETARAIGLLLRAYSSSSGPYEWTASRTEVASEDAGARLRYELSVTGHPGFKKQGPTRSTVRAVSPPDGEVREMARVVLRKCLKVRPGEHVAIETWSETLEHANALVLETLRVGARPLVLYQDEPTYWAAVTENRPADLARVGDHLRAAIAKSDALVTFFGPSDRERFHALPFATRYRLGEYYDHVYGAAAKAGTRAVQLALGRASPASARMYGVDLARWKSELVAATAVDPQLLQRRGARVARALGTGQVVEITHPNGTRLKLGLRRRKPQVSDGLVPPARPSGDWSFVQLPAGVVSVALDERVADGTFRSNVTNSVGVCDAVGEVEDGSWTFARGELRRFAYARGNDVFAPSYERAPAGKERVGVLSVGLNDRISMSPLLFDQEAGAVTLQIGRNDNVGGSNAVPWWAWLILRGADVSVDGRRIVRAGRLVE